MLNGMQNLFYAGLNLLWHSWGEAVDDVVVFGDSAGNFYLL